MNDELLRKIRLSYDSEYIEKSKKSICQYCINNLGFNGELYECQVANNNLNFEVAYKREGVFHSEIISCQEYEPIYDEDGGKIE